MNPMRPSRVAEAMAKLAALLVLLLAPLARAACVEQGVAIYPSPGSVIPTNGRFILEGVGPDQANVAALVGHELLLRGESDEVIAVKVRRGWKSAVNRTAVVLTPVKPMRAHAAYQLQLSARFQQLRWVTGAVGGDPSWYTGPGPDVATPVWQRTPEMAEGEYAVKSGRVTRHITIHLLLDEDSPAYLVLSLKPTRGAAGSQVYFAPINGGEAEIGADGCSGSFAFEDGGAYDGEATAVDASGNESKPVKFALQAPRQ